MNRLIAAIDAKRGIGDDAGIPWQGRIPSDSRYFVDQTSTGEILMGYRTYEELDTPLGKAPNLVSVRGGSSPHLRPGFIAISELEPVLQRNTEALIWVIGGAALFSQAIEFADELYLTQLHEEFRCTKFFPEFSAEFHLTDSQAPRTEDGIHFQFQIWRRNGLEQKDDRADGQPTDRDDGLRASSLSTKGIRPAAR